MDGSFLHPVLHGGVSLSLDVVMDQELDLCNISFSQLYLLHCFPPALLPGSRGPAFSKKLSLLFRFHGWDNLFTRLKIIKALNSLESVFTFRASPVPNFYVRLLGAIAIGGRLRSALGAEND